MERDRPRRPVERFFRKKEGSDTPESPTPEDVERPEGMDEFLEEIADDVERHFLHPDDEAEIVDLENVGQGETARRKFDFHGKGPIKVSPEDEELRNHWGDREE